MSEMFAPGVVGGGHTSDLAAPVTQSGDHSKKKGERAIRATVHDSNNLESLLAFKSLLENVAQSNRQPWHCIVHWQNYRESDGR